MSQEIKEGGIPMELELKASITLMNEGTLRALAALTVNNALCIKGITIREGKNGLFISMPRMRKGNGKYEDIVFPISAEYRKEITDFIQAEYQKKVDE